jgi:hypothetical protein
MLKWIVMPQIVMKLSSEELTLLRDRAAEIALTMSDYLRENVGFDALRRGVGRPPSNPITCPKPGCGAVVSAYGLAKHVRDAHHG